jgi:hypothetical protein
MGRFFYGIVQSNDAGSDVFYLVSAMVQGLMIFRPPIFLKSLMSLEINVRPKTLALAAMIASGVFILIWMV